MIGLVPPRVTVLMAMYNAGEYLRPAIESILAQSYSDFEFIIVDDGSTDTSVAVAESFADPRIRLVRNAANRGQTACLNQGLALAKGEFVARQDADDLSHPERLKKQRRFLEDHPAVVLLGANANQIDANGQTFGRTDLPRDTLSIRWGNLFDNSLLHSAVMFRTKVIREEFGGYDESFRCSQDYALWSLIARRHAVATLAEPLISLRAHPGSLMRAPDSVLEVETDRVLRANLAAEYPGRAFSEEEIGVLAEFRRNLTRGKWRPFRKLFDSLRSAFLDAHPEALRSREFARAEALQFARIGYNLLERDRFAAIAAYARAVRRWPRATIEFPWPRIVALALLGESARTLHRRIFPPKK